MSKLERNFFKVKKLRGKKKVILKAFGIQITLQKTLKKQRYCKTCGVDVGKGKSYCSPCVGKKIKKRESVNKRKRDETTLCGFEGCKESRGYGIHSCEYHSYKNRKKRHLEEIIQCNDCGVDLGKRKDFPYLGLRGKCESCKYKKMRNYQNKYYKERWHTDPEYKAKRKKWTTDWVEKTGWVR